MGITKNRGLLAVIAAGIILVGCSSAGPEEDTSSTSTTDQQTTDSGSTSRGATTAETAQPEAVRPTISSSDRVIVPLPTRGSGARTEELPGVFYFDFDQAIVKRSGHSELDKHAMVLRDNSNFRVRLEGHADERGTREYNLALGERRANAVRAYLTAQGASRSQIEVISYGEEKPAVLGAGESSWAKNRRVEIKYRN